ncbi:hypothetical protein ZOSMA_5769G00010, partial [Zostera marina]
MDQMIEKIRKYKLNTVYKEKVVVEDPNDMENTGAEGSNSKPTGDNSKAEGNNTKASSSSIKQSQIQKICEDLTKKLKFQETSQSFVPMLVENTPSVVTPNDSTDVCNKLSLVLPYQMSSHDQVFDDSLKITPEGDLVID